VGKGKNEEGSTCLLCVRCMWLGLALARHAFSFFFLIFVLFWIQRTDAEHAATVRLGERIALTAAWLLALPCSLDLGFGLSPCHCGRADVFVTPPACSTPLRLRVANGLAQSILVSWFFLTHSQASFRPVPFRTRRSWLWGDDPFVCACV
jgi:hypothetical protein